ncbi:amidase domain-containing protein [Paenibacillus humicus]|uniref:amidase domain-containing protein n=1 Tax=Paenibacillus humicus TaxID=412861 RepID=UPI000FD94158|nr:amidase domain-containing protein [Paenibacillus humicus]
MKLIRTGSLSLLVGLFVSVSVSPIATAAPASSPSADLQAAAIRTVQDYVQKAYGPYYTIDAYDSNAKSFSIADGKLSAQIDIHLVKTLKSKSVEEIPYVQGLMKGAETLKLSKDRNAARAASYVEQRKKEFQEYIGAKQEQNDSFLLTAQVNDGAMEASTLKLEFQNVEEWIPASAFVPASPSALALSGVQDLSAAASDSISVKPSAAVAAVSYDRLAARDYANKWTSERSPGDPDPTKYNTKEYGTYYDNDCANFVSQALKAGGIPTDATWKPYTIAWINTGQNRDDGLMDYMVGTKGYFKKATKTTTAAGGIINDVQEGNSHVMMVVANDGTTMTYSAHTTDRLKHSFATFSTSAYEFYVFNS